MALTETDRANFNTLSRAIRNGDTALVQSSLTETGEPRSLICVVTRDGKDLLFTPVAVMIWDDPFKLFDDPSKIATDPKLGSTTIEVEDADEFIRLYTEAHENKKQTFVFKGEAIDTTYASYMVEYLHEELAKTQKERGQ